MNRTLLQIAEMTPTNSKSTRDLYSNTRCHACLCSFQSQGRTRMAMKLAAQRRCPWVLPSSCAHVPVLLLRCSYFCCLQVYFLYVPEAASQNAKLQAAQKQIGLDAKSEQVQMHCGSYAKRLFCAWLVPLRPVGAFAACGWQLHL